MSVARCSLCAKIEGNKHAQVVDFFVCVWGPLSVSASTSASALVLFSFSVSVSVSVWASAFGCFYCPCNWSQLSHWAVPSRQFTCTQMYF